MTSTAVTSSLAGPVSRKLVSRTVNPRDNRQVLVCLTRTDRIAHHAMVAGELERNQRLVQEPDEQELGREEVAVLPGPVDRLTDMAAKMLGAEKDLN
jgi:DNA-binding MarR family transcriptional regulator